MLKLNQNSLQSVLLAGMVAVTAVSAVVPTSSVMAQTRTLPDFTDLVDQVGPSVVNIRTVERVKRRHKADPTNKCLNFSSDLAFLYRPTCLARHALTAISRMPMKTSLVGWGPDLS